jgi:hypothetical protein
LEKELISIGYGMYGKIYLCPSCKEKIYINQLHGNKCEYCLNNSKESDSLIENLRDRPRK